MSLLDATALAIVMSLVDMSPMLMRRFFVSATVAPPPPTPTTMAPPPPLALTVELTEPILVLAIRHAAISSLWNPQAISKPLCVLPRSVTPLATKAALLQLPQVDLDTASRVDDVALLRFMFQWSKQPGGRPLNYSGCMGVLFAIGSHEVLDWWVDESGLLLNWGTGFLYEVCQCGRLSSLDWWQRHGFPHWSTDVVLEAIRTASNHGQVGVLQWLLDHLPPNETKPIFERSWWVMQGAASRGHVQVLAWWWERLAVLGIAPEPVLADVLCAVWENNQPLCLEWCKNTFPVADVYYQVEEGTPDTNHLSPFSLVHAARHQLVDWIDILVIPPDESDYRPATQAACENANAYALQWLFRRGYLRGLQEDLIGWACQAKDIDMVLLDWIRAHVPSGGHSASPTDRDSCPFFGACNNGRADVFDWLIQNDFPLDEQSDWFDDLFVPEKATDRGHAAILDRIMLYAQVSGHELKWIAFRHHALVKATKQGHLLALRWWKQWLVRTDALLSAPLEQERLCLEKQLELAFESGEVDVQVLDWWLNHSGTLKRHVDFGKPKMVHEHCHNSIPRPSGPQLLSAFQCWMDAGLPIDFVPCIHIASVSGKVDVLDWLLHIAHAPTEAFVEAYTRYAITSDECDCNDSDNHGHSLLWWKANVPQVHGLQSYRYQYSNPIHMHLQETILMVPQTKLQSNVYWASLDGNCAMLTYCEEKRSQWQQALAGSIEFCLVRASEGNAVHVLEWWKSQSELAMWCPAEISQGRTRIGKEAKAWWLSSGLCDRIEEAVEANDLFWE